MSMGAGILICLLCQTPRMPRKNEEAWFWSCQNYTVCTVVATITPLMAENLDDKGEITEANKSIQRGLTSKENKRHSSQNIEEQSAQNKVIETAFRLEQTMEKMYLTRKLLEVRLEPAGQ